MNWSDINVMSKAGVNWSDLDVMSKAGVNWGDIKDTEIRTAAIQVDIERLSFFTAEPADTSFV